MNEILFKFYLAVLAIASISFLLNYARLDTSLRIIGLLVLLTFIEEGAMKLFHLPPLYKYPVYHVFSVIELFLTTLFFFKSIGFKRSSLLMPAAICLLIWITFALINIYYFQPITTLNSNMLLLESFVITAMAMIALYKILLNDHIINVIKHPYFLVWGILLVYWSSSYFYWAFIEILYRDNWHYPLIDSAQTILNILEYATIGIAFSLKPKWTKI